MLRPSFAKQGSFSSQFPYSVGKVVGSLTNSRVACRCTQDPSESNLSNRPGRLGGRNTVGTIDDSDEQRTVVPIDAAAYHALETDSTAEGWETIGRPGGRSRSPPAPAVVKISEIDGSYDMPDNLVLRYGWLLLSLGSLYGLDWVLKGTFATAGWTFPAPLAGMFMLVGALLAVEAVSPIAVQKVEHFFEPALQWVGKWLPLFYVPSLVTVLKAVQGLPAVSLGKVFILCSIGMPVTLYFTAYLAVMIRKRFKTQMMDIPKPNPPSPITKYHYVGWSLAGVVSLLLATVNPDVAGTCQVVFLLACTVGGLMAGLRLPEGVKKVFHPLIVCAVAANLGVLLWGQLHGGTYWEVLGQYLTKSRDAMGAGDVLMSFLGVVILSFGFRIFQQRDLMKRHAPEIFGSVVGSATFSLFATAVAAKALGLESALARAVVPRSVTVALALPIAQQLQANESITAASVMLTGLIGANFVQLLLDRFKFTDPIARGLATAGSSHGLGTAALSSKEPEALPYCAVAYALIGIYSTLVCSIPAVQTALLAITG